MSSGNVKRDRILAIKEQQASEQKSDINEAEIAEQLPEQEVFTYFAHSQLNVFTLFCFKLMRVYYCLPDSYSECV